MDADKKKQLISDYKNKSAKGAVYAVECSGNGRRIIRSTTDIEGIKNRYNFAMMTKSCPDPVMRSEFAKYGYESFLLIVLEELNMKKDQTAEEFAADVKLLYELWLEKSAAEDKK